MGRSNRGNLRYRVADTVARLGVWTGEGCVLTPAARRDRPWPNVASGCNATIWIYCWLYGGICHEYHAAETSAEPLPQASWPARDGPIRGPGARRRSRVDPVARQAARRQWP